MKSAIYFNYTTRSLLRGGQRTVLAVFCVAIGIMTIVVLQLIGLMIQNGFTSDLRDVNGGDLNVTSSIKPFTPTDLAFFDSLKKQGIISNYTPIISLNGSTSNMLTVQNGVAVRVVNGENFPLVAAPTFLAPTHGSIAHMLTGNQAIVDSVSADEYNWRVGNEVALHIEQNNQPPRILHVKIAGIVTDTGPLAQSSGVVLISINYYKTALLNAPLLYDIVDITAADQTHINQAARDIGMHFPLASTQSVADMLRSRQTLVDIINDSLKIAGLLALLISGTGIVNTMQVLLSRRKIEIAMLKTIGYHPVELHLLFGLEAALLGLSGGVTGALIAMGVIHFMYSLVQQTFNVSLPFLLDPPTIVGGILIGLLTASIFGLLPIVKTASTRPLHIIRESPDEHHPRALLATIGLLLLLSVLFCILSIVILGNVILGIIVVYTGFFFLSILNLFLQLLIRGVSKIPVPEQVTSGLIRWIAPGLVLSLALAFILPTFGAILLMLTITGCLVVFMPRSWKSCLKVALRNIGGRPARTASTMLAFFVGIFSIGLLLILGQDLRGTIDATLSTNFTYNIAAEATNGQATALQAHLNTIPGLERQKRIMLAPVVPQAIDGVSIQNLLKGVPDNPPSLSNLGRTETLFLLDSLEGYDIAHRQLPDTSNLTINRGRNLDSADINTDNVLVSFTLANLQPLKGHIRVGSTITLVSIDGKTVRRVKVVGFYTSLANKPFGGSILAPATTVQALSPVGDAEFVFYLKIASDKVGKALARMSAIAPNAFVFNLANLGDIIDQYLSYTTVTLSIIVGLSLLAGIIIIANAVALAMLERRRELGILKSVGYANRWVLGEVLLENGLTGGLGALLAMLTVTFVLDLLGKFVFHTHFGINGLTALALILGSALLSMITALLVADGAVRIPPLEVLRYE